MVRSDNFEKGADSPQRRATAHIAALALATEIGDRLPNIVDLRNDLGVGVGTVQTALRQLQASDALTLDTRKRRGTFLVARDVGALWRASELGVLSVTMPLPSAWEFYGLAAGFQSELDRLEVPVSLVHVHGSLARLDMLNRRPAVAIMSTFAAESHTDSLPGLMIANRLPGGTYYAHNSVLVVGREERSHLTDSARVGIDTGSIDHSSITRAEFPDRDYVQISYAHIPAALRQGLIDVAVWHRTALWLSVDDKTLHTSPLSQDASIQIAEKTSGAAVVTESTDRVAQGLLNQVSIPTVLGIQTEYVEAATNP